MLVLSDVTADLIHQGRIWSHEAHVAEVSQGGVVVFLLPLGTHAQRHRNRNRHEESQQVRTSEDKCVGRIGILGRKWKGVDCFSA